MRCPYCGHEDTQVKDSRPTEDHGAIRRRRHCPACGARFTTFERVQLRELTVVKSSGKREPFERDKLARSLQVALRKRDVEGENTHNPMLDRLNTLLADAPTPSPSNATPSPSVAPPRHTGGRRSFGQRS